jgi:hypothetical protein
MWVRFVGFFNGSFDEFRETASELIGSMFIDFDFDGEQMNAEDEIGTISFVTQDNPEREGLLSFRLAWSKIDETSFSASIEWDTTDSIEQLLSEGATTLANYFDDLVLLSAEQGLATNREAYQAIHCLEAGMRQAIVWALMQRHGRNWWRDSVAEIGAPGRWRTLGEKAQYYAERDQTVGHDRCEHDLIFYLDFSDLRTIVDSDPETFAFLQDDRERLNFAQDLSLLRVLRNRIMHGRYLTEENQANIFVVSRRYGRLLEGSVDENTQQRLGSGRGEGP